MTRIREHPLSRALVALDAVKWDDKGRSDTAPAPGPCWRCGNRSTRVVDIDDLFSVHECAACAKRIDDGTAHDRAAYGPVDGLTDVVETLATCLTEAHADEVAHRHHGDPKSGCSYCRAIGEARRALGRIRR